MHRVRACRRTLVALGALALLLALSGCIFVLPWDRTVRLTPFKLAHFQYLSGLSDVAHSSGGARIAAVFDQPGASGSQVIADSGGQLQVVGLDGSHARDIATDRLCLSEPAVSPDGFWVACVIEAARSGGTTAPNFNLEIAPLGPGSRAPRLQIPLSESQPRTGPAWSPDGRYLAVGSDCTVDIFAVSPGYTDYTLAGSFASPVLQQYNTCASNAVAWSPDSSQLLLNTYFQYTYQLDDHIPLAPILAARGTTVSIPASEFVTLSGQEFAPGPIWRPHTTAAMLVDLAPGSQTIVRLAYYTGPTRPQTVLLTLPAQVPEILAAAWTPDGSQLVLTVGEPQCVDCGQTVLPDIYLFTPTLPAQGATG